MDNERNARNGHPLAWTVLLLACALIGWQLYLGNTIQELGIPGVFTVKFGNPSTTAGRPDFPKGNLPGQHVVDDSHETQKSPSAGKTNTENPRNTERKRACMYKADADGNLVLQERVAEDIWVPNEDCYKQPFK
jgi:hypothetical protein